jgi:hypothetical protein
VGVTVLSISESVIVTDVTKKPVADSSIGSRGGGGGGGGNSGIIPIDISDEAAAEKHAGDCWISLFMKATGCGTVTVTNAVVSDGRHSVPVTVNGHTTFDVEPGGRWSDPIDVSGLDEGTLDFFAVAYGIVPMITPEGETERYGVVTQSDNHINYTYSDDCSSLTGWTNFIGTPTVIDSERFRMDHEFMHKSMVSRLIDKPPDQFILDIRLCVLNYEAISSYCRVYYYDDDWVLIITMDTESGIYISNNIQTAVVSPCPSMSTIRAYRFVVDKSGGASLAVVKVMADLGSGYQSLGIYNCSRSYSGPLSGRLIIESYGDYPV